MYVYSYRIIVACNYNKMTSNVSKGLLLAANIGCLFYLLPVEYTQNDHDMIYKIVILISFIIILLLLLLILLLFYLDFATCY